MRLKIVRIAIFVLFCLVAMDLFYMQVLKGQFFYSQSVNNRIRIIPLQGIRGRILDRNGVILVDNRLSFNVTVIPQDVQKSEELFAYLSQVLKVEKNKLLQRFFQRKVTPFVPVIVAEDIDKSVAMILEENKFRFPGLYVQKSFRRRYPFGSVGAHALGYLSKINRSKIEKLKNYGYTPQSMVGYSGVEEYYDSFLQGKDGGLQIEVNNRGQQVRLLSTRDPEIGMDIQLTMDSRIQQIAVDVLENRPGTIIVMNLDTGEVLGMVSAPSYDPNIFVDTKMNKKKNSIFTDPASPLLNRPIQGLYPAGSVFKIVLSAAGLETDKIKQTTTFYCPGYYFLGRRKFRCAHVHGDQDLIEGIAHSCNVYFYNLGLVLGAETIHRYARLLSLGSLTYIDLPAEEKGNIPGPMQRRMKFKKGWYKGDTLNFSIGQGDVLVTPLQLVRMVATIARKGREVQPHLVKKIGDQNIISFSTVRNVKIKQEVFDTIQRGLRSAVTDSSGTARILNLKGFRVSGKTGTAQTTAGRNEHAWFVGYETNGKEKIAICVFLEYGGSSYNACVLTRELLKRMKKEEIL